MSAVAEPSELAPDLDAAATFLSLFDEESERETWQTFDDDKERVKAGQARAKMEGREWRDPYARCWSGPLEEAGPRLVRANEARAGVFFAVNRMDGQGRRLANVAAVRAIWHEEDSPRTKAFPLEPSLSVESSPGKFHHYWRVDGLPKESFAGVMERMVQEYGSDPNAKDVTRVLRVPGFFHRKREPFMVRLVGQGPALPYSAAEILAAFPPLERAARPAAERAGAAATVDERTVLDLRSALRVLAADGYETWVRMGLALKGLGDVGRGLWLDWSATSDKYDDAAARAKWASFEPSQIGYQSVFTEAQAAGWVNTAKGRGRPAAATLEPVDFRGENEARLALLREIQAAADFDVLVYDLAPKVLASGLRAATVESLLKEIKSKTGVSLGALREGGGGDSKPGGGGGGSAPESGPPEYVQELNESHAVVFIEGKTRIMNFGTNPETGRPGVTFSGRNDFLMRYENRSAFVGGEMLDWGTAWLRHEARRQYRAVVFAPGEDGEPDVWNLWRGFGVLPEPGAVSFFLDFTREVICAGDEEAFAYVQGWAAHLFQRPADLPGVALVLRSGQRTGKNTWTEILGRCLGMEYYVELTQSRQLVGQFTGHLAQALLVFANEAFWGGDKASEGALKAMITDANSILEKKGVDAIMVRNFKRLVVGTNNDFPIPRDTDDARFVVLDVDERRKEDWDYFGELRRQLDAGGYAAILHYFLSYDLTDWHPRQIPGVLRLKGWDIKIRSGGSVMEWYLYCLEHGFLWRPERAYPEQGDDGGGAWPTPPREWLKGAGKAPADYAVLCDRVQGAYAAWCRFRQRHVASDNELGQKLIAWGVQKLRPREKGAAYRPYRYAVLPLDEARQAFGRVIGIPPEHWTQYDEPD